MGLALGLTLGVIGFFRGALTPADSSDKTAPRRIAPGVFLEVKRLARIPLAGMTALTRGPIGPVRANAQSLALLEAAVKETVAVGVALCVGVPVREMRARPLLMKVTPV